MGPLIMIFLLILEAFPAIVCQREKIFKVISQKEKVLLKKHLKVKACHDTIRVVFIS
jgi:hypothetical protein